MSSNPFRMSHVYDILLIGTEELLIGLFHLHVATAEQLTRLHYSEGSLTLIRKRLHTLYLNGYVQMDAIPTKKDGRSPRYYTLGAAGIKYLQDLGFDIDEAWRASNEVDKHGLFLVHTLELNDVIIAAARITDADPRLFLDLDRFKHERLLKRQPYKATVQTEQGPRPIKLIPDAFLCFGTTESDQVFAVMLEHDRGTEQQVYFKRKIRGYLTFLNAGAYREMFGVHRITVAFTTFQGERRLAQMRSWTRQVLAEHSQSVETGKAFRFAAFEKPLQPGTAWLEPMWHYPFDDEQPPKPLLAA